MDSNPPQDPTQTADRPRGWVEVHFTASPPVAEAFAEQVVRLSGIGVQWQELPDGRTRVIGYLAQGPRTESQQDELRRWAARQEEGELGFGFLAPRDWSENWKKHFKPFQAVPGLVIAPPWESYQPQGEEKVLILDPGMAFGTGHHHSTLLCLQYLSRRAGEGGLPPSVLDLGCGTGVLALAALLWGAQWAMGLDLDPEAIRAARHNARLNHLQERFYLSREPLQTLDERFPLVLANITALDLIALAPELVPRLAPGGELVLSGLLVEQVSRVEAAYRQRGLTTRALLTRQGWAALVLS